MRAFCSIVSLLVVFGMPLSAAAGGRILVVGDSLSAAYGIEKSRGWVALLKQRLLTEYPGFEVINASITGDTTRGGLSRLPMALNRERPSLVILELGANDGLRGFAPKQIRDNLAQLIEMSRDSGAEVLLLGIKLPMNYGRAFGEKFHRIYLDLAEEMHVPLVAFFLEGVAETRRLMQADGIHPAAEAQPRILDNVWAALLPLLEGRATTASIH